MKKVLFATLLVAALGGSEVKANSFNAESFKTEQQSKFFCYYVVSCCTVKEGN